MPNFPKDLKSLRSMNRVLDDIGTKIDRLSKSSDELLRLNPDNIYRVRDAFSDMEDRIRSVSKIAPNIAKAMEKKVALLRQEEKLNERAAKLLQRSKDLNSKNVALTKEEAEELSRITDELVEINKKSKEYEKQLRDTKGVTKELAKELGGRVLNAMEKIGAAGVNFGMSITSWSFDKAITGLHKLYDFQERSTRAAGTFRLEVGAFTRDLGTATKTATRLDSRIRALTGGDIGEGFKAYQEFSEGLGYINAETDKFAAKAWELGRATGAGADSVGKLYKNISLVDDSFVEGRKDTEAFMKSAVAAANEAGVSTAKFTKEIAGSTDWMASFGKKGRETFLSTAKYAAKLGVSLKSLQAFTDLTDTFQGSAEAAAKLNTVFGTSINAMEMMLEQDPSKRFDMVRRSMLDQGKTMKDLSRQEVKFLAQTLNISDEEVAAAIREGKTIDEIAKAREKEKGDRDRQEKTIRQALALTSQTLFNFKLAWDSLMPAIEAAIKPLARFFGLTTKDGKQAVKFGDVMQSMFQRLGKALEKIANNKKFQQFLTDVAKWLGESFQRLDKFIGGDGLDKMIGSATETFKTFFGIVKKVFDFVWDNKDVILKVFSTIAENMKLFIGLFIGAKIAKTLIGIGSLANSVFSLARGVGMLSAGGKGGGLLSGAGSMLKAGFSGPAAGGGLGAGAARAGVGAGLGLAAGTAAGSLVEAVGGTKRSAVGTAGAGIGGAIGGAVAGPAGGALGGIIGQMAGDIGNFFYQRYSSTAKAERAAQRQAEALEAAEKSRQQQLESLSAKEGELSKFRELQEAKWEQLRSTLSSKEIAAREKLMSVIDSQYTAEKARLDIEQKVQKAQAEMKASRAKGGAESAEGAAALAKTRLEKLPGMLDTGNLAELKAYGLSGEMAKRAGVSEESLTSLSKAKRAELIENILKEQADKATKLAEEAKKKEEAAKKDVFDLEINHKKKLYELELKQMMMKSESFMKFAQGKKGKPEEILQQFLNGKSLEEAFMTMPLASGGIVTKPTRALVAEAGPEAVIPLSAVGKPGSAESAAVRNLAAKTSPATGGGDVKFVAGDVYLDGEIVGRHMMRRALQSS